MKLLINCFIFLVLLSGLIAANEVDLEPVLYKTISTNITDDKDLKQHFLEFLTRLDTTKEELCQKKVELAHLEEQLKACNASRNVDRYISQMRLSMEIMNATQNCNKCDPTFDQNENVSDLCKTAGKDLCMIQLSTGRYFFSGNLYETWYGALKYCRLHGLDLLSIETMAEHKAVTEKAAQLYPPKGNSIDDSILISGTDQGREGQWFWASTGQDLNFTAWFPNQPDNSNGVQHCATIWNISGDFRWDDKNCLTPYKFICEMPTYCN